MAYHFNEQKTVSAVVSMLYLRGDEVAAVLEKAKENDDFAIAYDSRYQYTMDMKIGPSTQAQRIEIAVCDYETAAHQAYNQAEYNDIPQTDMVLLGHTAARVMMNAYAHDHYGDGKTAILMHGPSAINDDGTNCGYQFMIEKEAVTKKQPTVPSQKPVLLTMFENQKIAGLPCGKDGVIFAQGREAVIVHVKMN